MHGARLAHALAFLGCHPGDVAWRAGLTRCPSGLPRSGRSAPMRWCSPITLWFATSSWVASALAISLQVALGGSPTKLLPYAQTDVWKRGKRGAGSLLALAPRHVRACVTQWSP